MIKEVTQASGIRTLKLYVGSVPASASEGAIKEYFSNYGQVLRVIMFYDETGTKRGLHKGFCHLVLADQATFTRILEHPVHMFLGRHIKVSIHMRGGHLKNENAKNNMRRIIVKNLPNETTEEEINHAFGIFGSVEVAYLFRSSRKENFGMNRGRGPITNTASVMFFTKVSAQKALEAPYFYLNGSLLTIESYQHKSGKCGIAQATSSSHSSRLVRTPAELSKHSRERLATETTLTSGSNIKRQQYHYLHHTHCLERFCSSEQPAANNVAAELAKCKVKPTSRSYSGVKGISLNHERPDNLLFQVRINIPTSH